MYNAGAFSSRDCSLTSGLFAFWLFAGRESDVGYTRLRTVNSFSKCTIRPVTPQTRSF